MEVTSAVFVGSYDTFAQFPNPRLPEIAFIGRSNVGKSSLINKLLGVKNLAKTSSTPGKTRRINLFRVSENINFVDLPGYGFAKVSKAERQTWQGMIEGYLSESEELRLLVLLIDARHGTQSNDQQMLDWLHHIRLPYHMVLTKADKLKRNQLALIKRQTKTSGSTVFGATVCSAQTGEGMKDVWRFIDSALIGT
jgi:GTP-binding protein